VVTKATRQRFTMGYKRRIVREADACKTRDAVAAFCGGRSYTSST